MNPSISEVGNGHGWEAMYRGVPTLDARLLAHLARDGLLEALARLDEPRQRASSGPAGQRRLAAEQHAGRRRRTSMITTGSVRGWCSAPQFGQRRSDAALADRRRRAAGRAEAVAAVPVQQRGGVGGEPGVLGRERRGGLAHAGHVGARRGLRLRTPARRRRGRGSMRLGEAVERDELHPVRRRRGCRPRSPSTARAAGSCAWAVSHAGSPRCSAARSSAAPVNVEAHTT